MEQRSEQRTSGEGITQLPPQLSHLRPDQIQLYLSLPAYFRRLAEFAISVESKEIKEDAHKQTEFK